MTEEIAQLKLTNFDLEKQIEKHHRDMCKKQDDHEKQMDQSRKAN